MEMNVTENLTEGLSPRFAMNDEIVVAADNFEISEFSDEEKIQEESEEPDDVIILHMDIREPLRALRKLIEKKIGLNLKNYSFWLQDSQELEPHKNLVDQCVKGEGLVQINVQIQTTNERINIIDVLKPTEAALATLSVEQAYKKERNSYSCESLDDCFAGSNNEIDLKDENLKTEIVQKDQPCLNWVPDAKFKKEQMRLKIPDDPQMWTVPQVKHWFQWARREFNLTNVLISDWSINGKQLCALTHHDFRQKLPRDPGNIFWTHLQLLKECKYVAIVHKEVEVGLPKLTKLDLPIQSQSSTLAKSQRELKIMRKTFKGDQKSPFQRGNNAPYTTGAESTTTQMAPSGQMQLWQFLLELLTDSNHTDVIKWVGNDGEFVLLEPEAVARLWGQRKNKPAMNYEKLSRALRYYYDGDMISKVCGKRFAYKFDCDLKLLIGYDAGELARLVNHRPYQSEAAFAAEQIIKDLQSEADD